MKPYKCLLSICYLPGIMLSSEDTTRNCAWLQGISSCTLLLKILICKLILGLAGEESPVKCIFKCWFLGPTSRDADSSGLVQDKESISWTSSPCGSDGNLWSGAIKNVLTVSISIGVTCWHRYVNGFFSIPSLVEITAFYPANPAL